MKMKLPTTRRSLAGCSAMILWLASNAPAQNLFVANGGNNDIIEITSDGSESAFATGLDQPNALAFDNAGDMFEADYNDGDIYEFANNGGTLNSTPTLFASGLDDPLALAFNAAGNLFVSSHANDSIVEITPGGVKSAFTSDLKSPYRMAFNQAGDLFVAGDDSGNIYEFVDDEGTLSSSPTVFASGLTDPRGLAFNSAGDLFEADYESGKILEFTSGGVENTFASGLDYPFGLAFDSAGDLFVESGNTTDDDSIIEITSDQTERTIASGLDPAGMAFEGLTLPVPEPPIMGLLAAGALGLMARRRALRR
ncbi:MAG TPA: PEP-CTERM sorting domain-containing protein [Verrucomicrobiae bacterium]